MIGSLIAAILLAQETPLPALSVFEPDLWRIFYSWSQTGAILEGNRQNIEGGALKHYTYTEKSTLIKLDSAGKAREAETNLYHVIQGPEPWQYYRKHVSKNGVPVSAAGLEKQDREQNKREQKLRYETERAAREAEKKKKEQKGPKAGNDSEDFLTFVNRVFDIQVVRKELIDEYPTVLLKFTPKPGLKPKREDEKFMQHLEFRAWITESEHQPVKIEVEFLDAMSFGFGILGNIQPGTGGLLERRKINDEVWAPVRAEAKMAGRFLVKGMNQRQITEFSDFRKYTVETELNVVPEKPQD
jgi:hypothetical protein